MFVSEQWKLFGIFTDFEGFEGENQILLESFVADLPEVLKNITSEKVLFINGCHLYGVEMLGECPFGVWDSAGTFQNGQTFNCNFFFWCGGDSSFSCYHVKVNSVLRQEFHNTNVG